MTMNVQFGLFSRQIFKTFEMPLKKKTKKTKTNSAPYLKNNNNIPIYVANTYQRHFWNNVAADWELLTAKQEVT